MSTISAEGDTQDDTQDETQDETPHRDTPSVPQDTVSGPDLEQGRNRYEAHSIQMHLQSTIDTRSDSNATIVVSADIEGAPAPGNDK